MLSASLNKTCPSSCCLISILINWPLVLLLFVVYNGDYESGFHVLNYVLSDPQQDFTSVRFTSNLSSLTTLAICGVLRYVQVLQVLFDNWYRFY